MKNIILMIFFSIYFCAIAQNSNNNLACKDFTFQNKKCDDCSDLRNFFEIAISKPQYHFKLVEREKLDKIFEAVKEENNLAKDLSNPTTKKLGLAGADFLVEGDLEYYPSTGYELFIAFFKVSGKNVTEKLPLVIDFSKEIRSNNVELMNAFESQIDLFVKTYFIVKDRDSASLTLPGIYKEVHRLDSIKEQEIENVKDYANIARLDLYGVEIHYVGGISGNRSELLALMEQVWEKMPNGNLNVRNSDTALNAINTAIEKYPKFPFAYYAKSVYLARQGKPDEAIIFAKEAYKILKTTTTIEGHKPAHDEVFKQIKGLLQITN
jgi:hypothetical protein